VKMGLVVAGLLPIDPPLVLPSLFHAAQPTPPGGSFREPGRPARPLPNATLTAPCQATLLTAAPASSLVRSYGRAGIPARASLESPAETRPKQAMAGSTSTAAG
jgi:hypothetical protein